MDRRLSDGWELPPACPGAPCPNAPAAAAKARDVEPVSQSQPHARDLGWVAPGFDD
jgi:hypothetical protein